MRGVSTEPSLIVTHKAYLCRKALEKHMLGGLFLDLTNPGVLRIGRR